MMTDFNAIRSCFGADDDDPNDPEKFEIKNKRERKVSYNQNFASFPNNKKKRKKSYYSDDKSDNKENKQCNLSGNSNFSENFLSEFSLRSNLQTPVSNYRKISLDNHNDMSIKGMTLSDITEVKNDFEIEYDYGNLEYKLKLCDVDDIRIEELVTQMKFRLEEGGGECFYQLGVEDNGNALGLPQEELETSVENLKRVVEKLNATANITKIHKGKVGYIAEVMIKRNNEVVNNDKLEIKVGLLGEEGSGKSTLIGVLISNKLDNGKGLARFNVFRHKHEIICGKTSSISHQILGFDDNGELMNYGKIEKPSWAQIVNKSSKILNFYDMGGSNKNFKKTMTALSPNYLDYLFLVISAENGITEITEELMNYSSNMNLPIVCIVTKIDKVSDDLNFKYTIVNELKQISKKLKLNRVPIVIKTNDDIVLFSRNILEKNILPIFMISNMKWEGLNLLKSFLSMLPVPELNEELKSIDNEKIEFDVHETLAVDDKLIVTGIVNKGKLLSKTKCYLGPDNDGKFKIVEIVNIHCKKIPVKYVYRGQYCSIYIKSQNELKKENVRKGMVLLDINSAPTSVSMFEAELWTIDGTTKIIKYKYQPVLNIKHIRQGCRLKNMNELFLEESDEKFLRNLIEDSDLDNIRSKIDQIIIEKKSGSKCKSSSEINNYNLKKLSYTSYTHNNLNYNFNPDEAFIAKSTSKTKVIFEFMFNPEYLTIGSHIIINDQLIKAFGVVTKILK